MMKIKYISIMLVLVIVSACSNEDVIKIGFTGPLTGDVAVAGQENLNGIQLAIDELNSKGINRKKIELVVKDDRFDSKEAVTQYHQLTKVQNVDYVLTATYGGYLALAEQAGKDNVLLIETLDTSEELAGLSENAFAIGIYDESIGYTVADYLNSKNIREAGLVTNIDDPFMKLVRDAFVDRYQGEFQEEGYYFTTNDYKSILSKLSSYEYIVLFGFEETGLIVRQARQMKLNAQFLGIDTMASKDFRENSEGKHNGVLFAFWDGAQENPKYHEMMSQYKAKYSKEPENQLFVAVGYDAMLVFGKTLAECDEEMECIKAKLNEVKDFPGSTGPITIDSDRITRSTHESMHKYENGEIVPVSFQ